MKSYTRHTGNLISLLLFFLFITPSLALATGSGMSGVSNQNTQIVQGKVKSYNLEKQTILLKTVTGVKMTIWLDWQTGLIGYSSPQEIEKGHGLKIWYSVKEKKNNAVKIEKKLDVGC